MRKGGGFVLEVHADIKKQKMQQVPAGDRSMQVQLLCPNLVSRLPGKVTGINHVVKKLPRELIRIQTLPLAHNKRQPAQGPRGKRIS